MITTEFPELIAERMRAEHQTLAARWFALLLELLPVDARDVFPTDSLLDHIPTLIVEIGDYICEPGNLAIVANTTILEKARELGELRHQQRASLHQVLREYQLLGGVLVGFVLEEVERLAPPPDPLKCIQLTTRVNEAVSVLSQTTLEAFIVQYTRMIEEQNDRLEQFARMAAHEWRQPLSTLQVGLSLLRQGEVDSERAGRTLDTLDRNVKRLIDLTRTVETIARMQSVEDSPVVQAVSAATVAKEAARQLHDMALARNVQVSVADDLPTLTVDVGRLELTFVNLLSNAIKYSDPGKAVPSVDIVQEEAPAGWCTIVVRDNGLGIPAPSIQRIFRRFTRAHAGQDSALHVSGVGLGLAIVDDCVHAMGGEISVESSEGSGTSFVIRLPLEPQRSTV